MAKFSWNQLYHSIEARIKMQPSRLSTASGMVKALELKSLTGYEWDIFRHDTYDKVLEMSDFRKACLKSGMRRLISIENQLLNVYNCPSVEDIEQIKIYNE